MDRPRPSPAPRSRLARLAGLSLVVVVVVVAAGYALLPLAVQAWISAMDLVLQGGLWLATLVGGGADPATIAAAVGREFFSALASPGALAVIGGLVLVSAGALYGLQRMLDRDEG